MNQPPNIPATLNRTGGLPTNFKPEEAKQKDAKADLVIDYAKQVRHEGRRFRIRTERLRGHVAIYVEGIEVQIRAMELRGLLDPDGL